MSALQTAAIGPPSTLKTILYATSTNYLKVFVRMAGGIVTFRLLFKSLDHQDFGFYQLLWSTFGYLVLLDFGFGVSVQRAMAISAHATDETARRERREAVSTVFFSYVAIDLVVALALIVYGDKLLGTLSVTDPAALARYRLAAGIFSLGMLCGFPLGIYREALKGLNRIHLINLIDTIFFALTSGIISWGCLAHWSLPALMTASVSTAILPIVASVALALRNPDLRPRLKDFRLAQLRRLSSFSLFAYVTTMTGIIMGQSDQLVIGSLVSVQAIALYVPGFKLTQFYGMMSSQMQDSLGPIAANFGGAGNREALRNLLLNSERWSVLVATLVLIPLLFDIRTALSLLTGEHSPPVEMTQTALLLIGSVYFSIVGSSCTKRILLMTGNHRGVGGFSVLEAAINLGLSLYLTMRWKNVVGAAAGTFIASVCVPFLLVPFYAAKTFQIPMVLFLRIGARALLANVGALIAGALYWGYVPQFQPLLHFTLGALWCACAAIPGWWLVGMEEDERKRVTARLTRFSLSATLPTI